jgi:hypothetical protein
LINQKKLNDKTPIETINELLSNLIDV